jgi:ribonuclease HI
MDSTEGREFLASPYEIWADGACSGNPGPGGWGAVLRAPTGRLLDLSGAAHDTTNNQMELTAAFAALERLSKPSCVTLYTDSEYVQKGMTEWMPGWLKRRWKNAQGKPVANRELWERLQAAESRHAVTWVWVRGHAGDAMNERADQLAGAAREKLVAGKL